MDRTDPREAAICATLDAIRDLKRIGVSPDLEEKLDLVTRALAREPSISGRWRSGAFAGLFKIGPEFFEPMSDEERKEWHC